jgi:signal transduction protein with GAF and PtsI domain
MQLHRTLNIADITAEPGFQPKTRTSKPDYNALLVVPVILSGQRVFGAICIDAEAKGYFTEDDEFFVQCLAETAAMVLSRLE